MFPHWSPVRFTDSEDVNDKAWGLSLGAEHSCAISANYPTIPEDYNSDPYPGLIKCWGYNDHGQGGADSNAILGGFGATMGDMLPAIKLALTSGTHSYVYATLAAGGYHTCVMRIKYLTGNINDPTQTHEVLCFGYNGNGQLGTRDTHDCGCGANCPPPYDMASLMPITITATNGQTTLDVACGMYHTLVLTSAGTLIGFGDASLGELGVPYEGNQLDGVFVLIYENTVAPTMPPTLSCGQIGTRARCTGRCVWRVKNQRGHCYAKPVTGSPTYHITV